MGALGSGHWHGHDKKRTVEESWALRVSALPLRNPLSYPLTGTLRLSRIVGDRRILLVDYTLMEEHGPVLDLTYTTQRCSDRQKTTQRVELLTTKPNFGGVRWWFACPFTTEGERCDRRVAELHLPPGEDRLGCRKCHDLAYRSSQESHEYDSLYALIAEGAPEKEFRGTAQKAFKMIFSQMKKDARKRKKEEPTLLDIFEKTFGLGKWS